MRSSAIIISFLPLYLSSYQRKVEHYRVMYDKDKLTVDEESSFTNLTQLVDVS
jgi:hypothetical protein